MPPSDVREPKTVDDGTLLFSHSLGDDLRALRSQRRRAILQMILTVAGSLALAALFGLLLWKW